ncbi:hypothetical protein ACFQ15_07735 [Sphingomonas hankookensis]|uniref:hypothetical protein n=1 Tax=Sphingomonas hankookensis TaxID=563996 RepID=UPI001F561963|nr:hypothetical protein [Sphingomonas hankookensis]
MSLLVLMLATMLQQDDVRVRTVEVAGQRYTVSVARDRSVEVRGGEDAAPRTEQVTSLARTAIYRATGCGVTDSYWQRNTLLGTLDCTEQRIP